MNIILSVHKQWLDKIFSNEKIYEFRNFIPKNLKENDTIYFYETSKNNGSKKIVGECRLKSTFPLTNNGKFPMFGCYHFIEKYMKIIENDEEKAKLFEECKKYQLEEYKFGSLLSFALSPSAMKNIKNGIYPKFNLFYDEHELVDLGRTYMEKCDSWLMNMGYYDSDSSSYWEYAWELKDVKKYDKPLEIDNFYNKYGEKVIYPPQSYLYVQN